MTRLIARGTVPRLADGTLLGETATWAYEHTDSAHGATNVTSNMVGGVCLWEVGRGDMEV